MRLKSKTRFQVFLILLVTLMLVMAGCSSSETSNSEGNANTGKESNGEPKRGGEITVAYVADVTNFDPIKGTTGNDHSLLWPVYDTLVKFTSDLQPEPGLAESWDIPDDKTMILHLRKGVTFQDGTAFDAEAVKFNIERVNSTDSQVSDLKSIESVEVVDEHTVKFHLSKPDSSILLALTDRGGMMVSPTAVNKNGADFTQNPVGAGPFEIANHVPNGQIEYQAYKDYWKEGQPYLDKITVKVIPDANSQTNALKTGQVDFVPGVQAQMIASLEKNPEIVLSTEQTLGFNMLYLKTNEEPFKNKEARLAVLYGINREEIINAINFGQGEATAQPFPKGYWAYDEGISIKYDPDKAKQLLKDSGLTDVSFTLATYPIDYWTRLANAIKGQLEKVGITVKVEPLEANAAVQKFMTDKETDSLTGSWSGRPDPQMTINSLYSKDSFYNHGKISTSELDALLSEVAGTYDQDKRAELYGKIVNEAVIEQAFSIPLFSGSITHAMDKKIKGFKPNLLGKPIFSEFWVEQK